MFSNIGYAAIIAAVVALWSQIKSLINNVLSIIFVSHTFYISHDDINKTLLKLLIHNSKIIKFGNKNYKSINLYNKKINIWETDYYSLHQTCLFLYKKIIPIFVIYETDSVTYKFIYKTFDYKSLLKQKYKSDQLRALAKESNNCNKNTAPHTYFRIREIVFSKQDYAGSDILGSSPQSSRSNPTATEPATLSIKNNNNIYIDTDKLLEYSKYIDSLYGLNYNDFSAFAPTRKEKSSFFFSEEHLKLKQQIKFWKDNVSWFSDKELPHRRGALLYGPPGTGKSRGVIEIAKELDIPVAIIYLTGSSNQSLKERLSGIEPLSIILFEDIDRIFEQRNNISVSPITEHKLSFDYFINCLSGIGVLKNSFVILTTNHIEKLDSALIRDGRMDVKIEFRPICNDGRKFIASKILSDWPEYIDEIVKNGAGMAAAQFENLCITKAIDLKWSELDVKTK